jgi:K+-sensing histidine kinase KdpD
MEGVARGTLRIYLGAAPGVGKTFAMLGEAHRRASRGTDVVVGLVETHGRRRTAEQLEGLEVLPRKPVTHRGVMLTELDVDAVLARRPQLVVVDELAHTNAPGSRHEKRWQDVDDILATGINVLSTVNVQHLESLNDVVEQITGITQQEQERHFAPFQRLGDAPAGQGVGLGLAVARGLTEAMGGTLTAEETPGGGLTMIVSLDAAAVPALPPAPIPAP